MLTLLLVVMAILGPALPSASSVDYQSYDSFQKLAFCQEVFNSSYLSSLTPIGKCQAVHDFFVCVADTRASL